MTTRILGATVLAAVVAATTVPLYAADKEQRQMMADLRILQEQSQQLQNLIGQLSQSLTEAIKAVNQRLDDQTTANRKSFADQKLVIDNAAADLRILKEKVDDNSVRVGSLTQELDALRQSVAAINTPRGFGTSTGEPDTVTSAATADAGTAPATAGVAAGGVGGSPQKLLDGAQGDYWGGQYDLAILGFDSYIKSFPNSPQADYAQYYIGNSYYQKGDYQKAIDAFNAVIKTYPKSSYVPEAYAKMGISYQTLKDTDKARQAFEFVIKTYPDSVAATIAQQKLTSLPKR
jgi:tol-pal system protein YbgF